MVKVTPKTGLMAAVGAVGGALAEVGREKLFQTEPEGRLNPKKIALASGVGALVGGGLEMGSRTEWGQRLLGRSASQAPVPGAHESLRWDVDEELWALIDGLPSLEAVTGDQAHTAYVAYLKVASPLARPPNREMVEAALDWGRARAAGEAGKVARGKAVERFIRSSGFDGGHLPAVAAEHQAEQILRSLKLLPT